MVSRPHKTDYIKSETGTIRKHWNDRIRIALVYPNHYSVGMSNLGFQTAYRLFNAHAQVVCERVFLGDEAENESYTPKSLESNQRLSEFDIIAASISFENDYISLLSILKQAGLPLWAKERSPTHPLVIAGGGRLPVEPRTDCPLYRLFSHRRSRNTDPTLY